MIDAMEMSLRPVDTPMPQFPSKVITLKDGQKMVMRQIGREETALLLPYVEPLIHLNRDFYNIVASRLYSELLGYVTYRVQDEYVIIGQIDGELAAIVNGRTINPKVGLSYHTFTLKRGLRVGALGFATKMEYHFDFLNHQEVLVVAESPIGFRRWMEEYKLVKRFEIPHELGGCPSWALTKELYNNVKGTLVLGDRPVPADLLAKAQAGILAPKDPPKP
jgi:hypothetical protein